MRTTAILAQGRRIGVLVLGGPLITGAALAGIGWWAAELWPTSQAMTLVLWLAQLFTIATGICAAVALTGDPLVELHESTPTGFRTAQFIRAGLIMGSGVLGGAILFFTLNAVHVWPRADGWTTVFAPAGAAVIITVIALTTSALSGTASATTMAVVAAWVFLAMLWDPYVLPLWAQRGIPLAVCAALVALSWRRLASAEATIAKAATA